MATLQVNTIGQGTVAVNDPTSPRRGRTAELVITPAPGWKVSDVLVETVAPPPTRTGCCFAQDEGTVQYPYRGTSQCIQGPVNNVNVAGTGFFIDVADGERFIYELIYTCDSGTCEERAEVDTSRTRFELGNCAQLFEDQS
jgi:hypothetical protein